MIEDIDDPSRIPVYGVFDLEEDDFVTTDNRYKFYWSPDDAERMVEALGDDRYVMAETSISARYKEDKDYDEFR